MLVTAAPSQDLLKEDRSGNAFMAEYGFRKRLTYIKTVFDEVDIAMIL